MIPKLNEYKKRWNIESDDAIKPGLQAIKDALSLLGNPERNLKVIHVSGTNGKGSTIQMMESILLAHGYTVGVFTSPAIIDIHDQIKLNGEPITKIKLDLAFERMQKAGLSGKLTNFELLTVAAFTAFEMAMPDYIIVETGMGGRLDSTNVVMPLVSVITSIALDHTAFLGETLQEIAAHKAGIIKKETPVITGILPDEALQVVREKAGGNNAPLKIYGKEFIIENEDIEIFKGSSIIELPKRKMKGAHQKINIAIAIEALLSIGIQLKKNIVQTVVAADQLSFRFEEILPGVILDGAHNPASAAALTKTIQSEFPGKKVDFFIGMLKGKDIKGTLDELLPVAHSFTFTTFDHSEAATGEELMKNCNHARKKVTKEKIETIILDEKSDRVSIVSGSLYLLSSLKGYLEG